MKRKKKLGPILVQRGYDGQDYALVDERGRPVRVGQRVRRHVVMSGRAPHKASSSGRILIRDPGWSYMEEVYPGVLHARWLPRAAWHRNPGDMGPAQLARLKKGWIKLDPTRLGGGMEPCASDTQHVDPRTRAQVLAAAAEYEALALEVDRRYEAGLLDGIEDLEQRVAELEHWLDHALDALQLLEDETQAMHETHMGLEELLFRAWANYAHQGDYAKGSDVGYDVFYEPGRTREQVLAENVRRMARDGIRSHGGEAAGLDPESWANVSDEAAIAAARDAWERRMGLRIRYKRPGKPRIDPSRLGKKK